MNRSMGKDDLLLTLSENKLLQTNPQLVPNIKVAKKNLKALATIRRYNVLGEGSSFKKSNDDFLESKIPLGHKQIAEKFQPAFR